ncbi:MAG: hypothetical protein IPI65_17420 [Bacteroidetes bacterium]|nr:hypothetical protein [Bacteroidota bacterium]
MRGYYDSSPSTYFDQGNIVGSLGEGNTITNYGGSSATLYMVSMLFIRAILLLVAIR